MAMGYIYERVPGTGLLCLGSGNDNEAGFILTHIVPSQFDCLDFGDIFSVKNNFFYILRLRALSVKLSISMHYNFKYFP